MKLSEITSPTYVLNEQDWDELQEVFDSKIDVSWSKQAWGYIGGFSINDQPYKVELRKTTVAGLKGHNPAEVSFYLADVTDDSAFASTNKAHHIASTIYGVVFNALNERYDDFDAFYFSAETRHSGNEYSKKVALYTHLATQISRRRGATLYVSENASRTDFLLSKIEPTGSHWVPYRKKIAEDHVFNELRRK